MVLFRWICGAVAALGGLWSLWGHSHQCFVGTCSHYMTAYHYQHASWSSYLVFTWDIWQKLLCEYIQQKAQCLQSGSNIFSGGGRFVGIAMLALSFNTVRCRFSPSRCPKFTIVHKCFELCFVFSLHEYRSVCCLQLFLRWSLRDVFQYLVNLALFG